MILVDCEVQAVGNLFCSVHQKLIDWLAFLSDLCFYYNKNFEESDLENEMLLVASVSGIK